MHIKILKDILIYRIIKEMKIASIFEKYIKLREKLDQAKIHKLVDNTNDKIYIGSTCKTLEKRLSEHKSDYKRFLKGIFNNVTSFDILKNNDYKIELIENCNIKTKQELLARERYFIQNYDCLNKNIPGNFDDKGTQQYQKDYYEANENKLKEKFECSCGGRYTYGKKAKHEKTTKHIKYLESKI